MFYVSQNDIEAKEFESVLNAVYKTNFSEDFCEKFAWISGPSIIKVSVSRVPVNNRIRKSSKSTGDFVFLGPSKTMVYISTSVKYLEIDFILK